MTSRGVAFCPVLLRQIVKLESLWKCIIYLWYLWQSLRLSVELGKIYLMLENDGSLKPGPPECVH